jgi:pullulanase/glycogen debranching enzyme
LQRRKFFKGELNQEVNPKKDIFWLNKDSSEMKQVDWLNTDRKHFGVVFDGQNIDEMDEDGRSVVGNTLLIICNAHWEAINFALPPNPQSKAWQALSHKMVNKTWKLLIETSGLLSPSCWSLHSNFLLEGRSIAVFELAEKDDNA